ncbi:MAG: hypothetical protein WD928_01680 [Gammaproteobacteria bacterium]
MDFDAVNAIAQIVAAVGVVATLGYLAVQVRQNTRAIRRSAYQELLNYITNANLMLTADRSLCELAIRARDGLDRLEEPDQMRMLAWYNTVFRHYQNAYKLFHDGVITAEQWDSMSAPLVRHLASPGGRDMWREIRESLMPEFRAFVEAGLPPAEHRAAR